MKLIVGLGNPGSQYRNNRHNVGYMVADMFAISEGHSWKYSKEFLSYTIKTKDFILIKPANFMNQSGECVRLIANYYKIAADDILVVHDELDLEFGKIRLSVSGSAAGHHGVESVTKSLGTAEYVRLRIGIGKPEVGSGSKYVLEDFVDEEKNKLADVIAKSEEALKSYLDSGIDATMNRFN